MVPSCGNGDMERTQTHTATATAPARCMRKTMHRGRYSERKVRIFVDGSGFRVDREARDGRRTGGGVEKPVVVS